MIVVCDTDNMKFGYINKKGEIAIPCKYDAADSFRNGKALTVIVKGYDEDEEEYEAIYSIIDTDGDVVENLTESDAEDYESVDEDPAEQPGRPVLVKVPGPTPDFMKNGGGYHLDSAAAYLIYNWPEDSA